MATREEHPLVMEYRRFSPGSETLAERSTAVFPGGDTRSSAHYGPYPLVMDHGSGCHITDVDGHEQLDFMNNFTSLIHGHAHPDVVAAVKEQAGKGSAYAATSLNQIELAELIVERVPSATEVYLRLKVVLVRAGAHRPRINTCRNHCGCA